MHYNTCHRLCRAIALAAKAVKLTFGDPESTCTIFDAVSSALKYVSDEGPSTGSDSLNGFLQLTDSIIYAIKIAGPTESRYKKDLEAVKLNL